MKEHVLEIGIYGDKYEVKGFEVIPGLAVFEIKPEELHFGGPEYPPGWRVAHIESGMFAFDCQIAFETKQEAFDYCERISGLADYTKEIWTLMNDVEFSDALNRIEIKEGATA